MTDWKDAIQVVLSVFDPDGKYCRHAGVVVTSLFSRASSRVCVTILHDETLTEDNKARFLKTADVFGQAVRFIDVSPAISSMPFSVDDIAGNLTRGTLFRLLMPDVIDAAKVIYLDCDIAVNLDIAELWNIDVEGFSLAAAPDQVVIDQRGKTHYKIRAWAMEYDDRKYFNAGVLLMNLDRIRQRKINLVESAVIFFKCYRLCNYYADQDFLNSLFCGDTLLIDERFNSIKNLPDIENTILHFAGGGKPWKPHSDERRRDCFYWETLLRSEWRDQFISAMFDMLRDRERCHP
ncbi:MAG: glycosyltransferase family 8 protein, partial [Synergistaceae bacterium]|nr:glycosyltransferase family 8 protein [Synergistaceae bacterium]